MQQITNCCNEEMIRWEGEKAGKREERKWEGERVGGQKGGKERMRRKEVAKERRCEG